MVRPGERGTWSEREYGLVLESGTRTECLLGRGLKTEGDVSPERG